MSTNIALNKTCAQSTQWGGYVAEYGVDGNMSTQQAMAASPNDWFKVDLGYNCTIDSIDLHKVVSDRPTASDYAFTANVVDVVTADNDDAATKTHIFSPYLRTRYLRVITTTETQFIDTYEYQIYGMNIEDTVTSIVS